MNNEKLASLKIHPAAKRRSRGTLYTIILAVAVITVLALYNTQFWKREGERVFRGAGKATDGAATSTSLTAAGTAALETTGTTASPPAGPNASGPASSTNAVLIVSGYIINRERIELSPRFMGQVKWIGVRKGDVVTNGQVVVLLDDAEYQARLAEQMARLASARINVEKAELAYNRTRQLASQRIESQQLEDDTRLTVEAAKAMVNEVEGQIALTKTYLDWCVIRSPINGVVLEKLVDPNELVTPQSFGGTRGPSTALISVADTKDLQVEIDLNEADVSKVFVGQKCRVSPEAYLERGYEGVVAEIAPEASRQKGTLQLKVQILNPDKFLTPELSAKVEFLAKGS
jgi:HlyD family secretion protein